jgi:LysM repeat protein
MKSKAPITTCVLASIVALGATGYGFASGTLFKTRQSVQAANDFSKESFAEFDGLDDALISGVDKSKKIVAIDMDSIPDHLTTDKSEGSEPLYVEGDSGQQYAVTDSEGNTVYIKDQSASDESKTSSGKGGQSDIDKSDLYVRYTVQRGDTLSRFSNEFGSSVDTLVRLNNINNPYLIYTDEVLHIPSNPPVIVSEDGEVSEP